MTDLPTPIRNFVLNLTLDANSPAYLLVDRDTCLSDWGGDLNAYGIMDLQKGAPIGEQVFFLEGLLPLDESPFSLPYVNTNSGLVADVHIFQEGPATWVLLLDATGNAWSRRRIQQKANDLSLYLDKLKKAEEALGQDNDELELRVRERTAELSEVNRRLKQELEERKRVETALRECESRFRRLSESNMIGIMFWDLDGAVTEANDAFLQMLGFTHTDLVTGRIRWAEITRPELRYLDDKAIEEMRSRGACTPFARQFIRKDGRPVTLLFGAALLEGSRNKTICFALELPEHT